MDKKGLRWISPKPEFHCKNYDLEYKQERRKKNEDIFEQNKKWHSQYFQLVIEKISLKIFEQEMRNILKIFPNIFDQK
jgi:hypothetical protein